MTGFSCQLLLLLLLLSITPLSSPRSLPGAQGAPLSRGAPHLQQSNHLGGTAFFLWTCKTAPQIQQCPSRASSGLGARGKSLGRQSVLQSVEEQLRKAEALLHQQPPSCGVQTPQCTAPAAPPADWVQQQQQAVAKALVEKPQGDTGAQIDPRLQLLLQRAAEGPGVGGHHLIDVRLRPIKAFLTQTPNGLLRSRNAL